MFQFFANLFGYLLELLYNLVNNYGLAIILFTVTIKLILLPLSIKQQRTTKKSAELQEKMKILQFKYKNDPEKLNQEMMKFLDLQIGMELLSIRSSNIAFTMGARGILLEKSYSYSGTIEKY